MTLTSRPLAGLIVFVLFGGIFFSSATGWWQTESTKQAAVIKTGAFAGQANPADIRGSYTFGDVEKNFAISPSLLAEAFGIMKTDPAAFAVKGLEEMYAGADKEVGTASVRLFVALYKGMPYDLSADIYLPESAAALLGTRNLTSEQTAYVAAHTVPNVSAEPGATAAPGSTQVPAAASTPATPAADSTVRTIKGNTLFSDLLNWGVSKEAIEQVLGTSMPAAATTKIKDYATEKGLNFETIKPALQTLVDQVK